MVIIGVYDSLPKGSQVKCWGCEMESKKVGDHVPDFGETQYVVLLREGGFVKVEKGIITQIVENYGRKYYYPKDFPGIQCVDKWGSPVNSPNDLLGSGIMGEGYY